MDDMFDPESAALSLFKNCGTTNDVDTLRDARSCRIDDVVNLAHDFSAAMIHPTIGKDMDIDMLYDCNMCQLSFIDEQQWKLHMGSHDLKRPHECSCCGKCYSQRRQLMLHLRHCRDIIDRQFDNDAVEQHGGTRVNVMNNHDIEDISNERSPQESTTLDVNAPPTVKKSSLKKTAIVYTKDFTENDRNEPFVGLKRLLSLFKPVIAEECQKRSSIKFFVSTSVMFHKSDDVNEITDPPVVFRSEVFRLLKMDKQLQFYLDLAHDQIVTKIEQYQKNGSAWVFSHFLTMDTGIVSYDPLRASSFIPLPSELVAKKALTNVKNNDNRCFLWSVLASLHPVHSNANRVSKYKRHVRTLNLTGLTFPMKLRDIGKFEAMNSISVHVFGYEEKKVIPLRISDKLNNTRHVNLLLISEDNQPLHEEDGDQHVEECQEGMDLDLNSGNQSHYVTINSMSRLLNGQYNRHKQPTHFCHYCLHGCSSEEVLRDHVDRCSQHNAQRVRLPMKGDMNKKDIVYFKRLEAQMRLPFVIYADTESLLVEKADQGGGGGATKILLEHVSCCYGILVKSSCEEFNEQPFIYRGPDAMTHFLNTLAEKVQKIKDIVSNPKAMIPLTSDQKVRHDTATTCFICCKGGFSDSNGNGLRKVMDHDHITGSYRGPAHSNCNLKFRLDPDRLRIPCIFHNLRGYDAHHIMASVNGRHGRLIECIPLDMEKYIMFKIGRVTFIDSMQFMPSSLSSLVDNLSNDQLKTLNSYLKELKMSDELHNECMQLMRRKGVYPYEYMDGWERFDETSLPSIDKFYSHLTEESISGKDYNHAQIVFEKFNMKNLGEYHDFYLLTDVLLLADVFEAFRDTCLEYYGLDPCHFYTSPGMAWDAALKMTGVKLELLCDVKKHLFFEAGLRGGVATIAHRHAKANNPSCPEYDPSKPTTHLVYWDAK